ncbi:hypothetical protein BGZ63DRAFT_463153 [Mariannaea sp. PMI_226]|nr:hypothetical protein BGZ63DRAFT_463153 [Mariannaea sp. PMI_226]
MTSKPSHSKPSRSQNQSPKDSPHYQENKSVWKAVESRNGNPNALIIAVVSPEQKKLMRKLIEDKKQKGKIQSTVVVTTQEHFQGMITSTLNKSYKTLYLFVSSTIKRITYDIPNDIKDVQVAPCRPPGRPDVLLVSSTSTYCGVKTYAWDQRTDPKLRKGGYQISHAEGCHFDISDDMDEARILLQVPVTAFDMSPEEQAKITHEVRKFQEDAMSESNMDTGVSSSAENAPSPAADDTNTWFQRAKSLIAVLVGAGAGLAAMAGTFWVSAGGVYLKGPLGLSMAAGYFNMCAIGGVCIAGTGAAIAAGAAVYFIPWDKFWNYLKNRLWQVWEKICNALTWIWEQMKTLGKKVVSMFTG